MAMGERREESRRLQVNIHVTVQMMDFDAAVDLDSMTMGPLMLAAECEHLLPRKNHTPVFFYIYFEQRVSTVHYHYQNNGKTASTLRRPDSREREQKGKRSLQ
jgi:hypothetical protein